MFISKPEQHRFNIAQAHSLKARPAVLTAAIGGDQEPAVIIRSKDGIHGVIPVAQALRLANEIADAADAHRSEVKHG